MKKSAELKQLRAQKIEAQTALRSTAVAETRDLNDDETTKFRSLQTDIEGLSGQINDAMAYEENLRSIGGGESTSFTPEVIEQRAAPKLLFFE
jgi:predicted flavoprotein YhiN